jgi:hypothetical protein
MGPIHCPETSVKDCHSTLRNIAEERRSHQHGSGSFKVTNVLKISFVMLSVFVYLLLTVVVNIISVSVFFAELFGMQFASFLRRIILSSVASLVVADFPTLSHRLYDFWKKILKIKCVF